MSNRSRPLRGFILLITGSAAGLLPLTAHAQVQVQGGPASGTVIAQPVGTPSPQMPPAAGPVARPVIAQPVQGQPIVMGQPVQGRPVVVGPPGGFIPGPIGPQQTINLQVPPQPPPQTDRFVAPGQAGQRWIPGHWDWIDGRTQWVPGHWEAPPQPGFVWVDPQWNRAGRRFGFRRGYWAPPAQIGGQFLQPGAFGIPTQPRPYQPGEIVSGSLDTTDFHLPQGGYADDYAVFLQAGQPVTFVVTGGTSGQPGQPLDVVASVLFQGRELASDDDGAGFPHARLVFVPPATGVYALRVTSFGARFETGSYMIQSWQGAMPNAQPFNPQQQFPQQPFPQQQFPQQPFPQQQFPQQPFPQQQFPGQAAVRGLQLNTTVEGILQPGSAQLPRGGFVDRYVLALQAGQPVTFLARGRQTQDPQRGMSFPDLTLDVVFNGATVAHDDDSAGNRNPRIVFVPSIPGQYIVQVGTYGGVPVTAGYTLVSVLGANPQMQ